MRLMILLMLVAGSAVAEEITFTTDDGVTLYADWYGGGNATVVLFHQAQGSARGEYPAIIEALREKGYSVLAVDQRSGGDRFGAPNRTVEAIGENDGYCEAYPDLLAAVAEADKRGSGPIAVWGSSYSAGLVLKLAAEHGAKIDAALAFSPASGGPMADCSPMGQIGDIEIPVIAFRPDREMEVPSVVEQAEVLREHNIPLEVVEGGVHGSSMLVEGRSNADLNALWTVVDGFLTESLSH